jgi:hypothetical protein
MEAFVSALLRRVFAAVEANASPMVHGRNMAQAKIEVKIGNISLSGAGDSAWLEAQLD